MLISEPSRSAYDLHFTLLGVPIRVHPSFWFVSLVFGLNPGSGNDPAFVALWVAASFVSILVHEMGHALVIRQFGTRPWITLYGMGGLASSAAARRTPQSQILISLAGPAAGFALFGLIVALVAASGHHVQFQWDNLPHLPVWVPTFENVHLWDLTWILLFQNFYWNVLNLLPIYPLDGGQVSREVFQLADPGQGLRRSLILSVLTAGGMAVYAVAKSQGIFMILFFGVMAYESYTMLERIFPGRGMRGRW